MGRNLTKKEAKSEKRKSQIKSSRTVQMPRGDMFAQSMEMAQETVGGGHILLQGRLTPKGFVLYLDAEGNLWGVIILILMNMLGRDWRHC